MTYQRIAVHCESTVHTRMYNTNVVKIRNKYATSPRCSSSAIFVVGYSRMTTMSRRRFRPPGRFAAAIFALRLPPMAETGLRSPRTVRSGGLF